VQTEDFIQFSKLEKFDFSVVSERLDSVDDPECQRIILIRAFAEAKVRRDEPLVLKIANHCDLHDRLLGEAFATGIGLDYRKNEQTKVSSIPQKIDPFKSGFWGDLTPAQKIGWGAAVLAALATVAGVVFGFFKPG
jgi:hypothetical protein